MKKQLNAVIAQLETIQVSGINTIKMGNALLSLMHMRDSIPDEQPEPEEGEDECQP